MAPQKGKQGTKGQKQILEENQATLSFYRNLVLGFHVMYILWTTIFYDIFTLQSILLVFLATASYLGSYQFMVHMAKTTVSETGQLLDSGLDLNMEGGIAEHMKDLIILTAGCQATSLISNYFWLLWLLAPGRAIWLLWKNVLGPWFSQSKGEPEPDEKKQRKLDRKMRRGQL
ncbi:UNVERIFIED_CONTAM: hypothetical protein B566_EDAN017195 [Ephemera danica]|nr:hypothetical protein B566_EDAN017195 [Ephemera danica]